MGKVWSHSKISRKKISDSAKKRYKNSTKLVSCKRCSKKYKVPISRLEDGRGKYCSKDCHYKDKKGFRRSKNTEFKKGQRPWNYEENKTICKQCSAEFISVKSADRKFCSKKCLFNSGLAHYNCEVCLKKITTTKSIAKIRRFCSNKCQGVFFSKENSINWKGGITPINERLRRTAEYKQWRKKVYERDNYTCQNCGERGGNLNADHIKPFSSYPELRTVLENGRTLCKSCHIKTDTWGGVKVKNHE